MSRCSNPHPDAFSRWEQEEDSEVLLAGRLREAIRRLNQAIPSRTLTTLSNTLLRKLRSRELSVADTLTKSL